MTRLQDSHQKALRPARLLPPKRLLTPRSARHLSATNRGLLPGAPTPTRTGLPPAGVIQLRGRNMRPSVTNGNEAPAAAHLGRWTDESQTCSYPEIHPQAVDNLPLTQV